MQKDLIEKNPILKLSFEFSLLIIDYCGKLDQDKKFAISKQLFRSGTSIGANAFEAQNSESKADFIHKIKISAKEADEAQYWLTLCDYSKEYPSASDLLIKLEEIGKILNKILSTSRKKNPFSYIPSFFI
ncbi:four helix bundle protein [Niabella yanshanensis]|uniref:Four helix bundle protein n=1 Tax=Niabella yanshanensis TaxID=577386 RepID=A0ABZ0W2T7_9BACT|nr:four helix bundle protein [Niabella yanshanensis]WQD37552.1 four helix bundle protein [Niabella yanshanensis]